MRRDRSRGSSGCSSPDDAGPPGRRHLRAVPCVLRTQAAGLREGPDPASGVSGLVDQLLFLLREQGATHVGAATDRVIESFRNDLYPGYKSSAGMDPSSCASSPSRSRRSRRSASSSGRWSSGRRTTPSGRGEALRRRSARRTDRDLHARQGHGPARRRRPHRPMGRRRDITYDEPAVRTKWGVEPESVPDRLALVGDSSDGFPGLPGWGDKAAAAVLAKYLHLEAIPPQASAWEVRGLAARSALPRPSATGWTRRSCIGSGQLRTVKDGSTSAAGPRGASLAGRRPRDREAFCDQWGLERLRTRPHRWR